MCGYTCEQVCMPVGVTHSSQHPSDQARRKGFRWREDSQGCTVSSVLCTEGVRTRGRWERWMLSRIYRGRRVSRVELLKVVYSTKVTCRCT